MTRTDGTSVDDAVTGDGTVTVARYLDPRIDIESRIEDLLARMTRQEKVGQMLQLDARQGLPDIVVDKLAGSILHASPERIRQALELNAGTRLAIPLLVAEDCMHGHSFWPGATIFPTQLAMACSWDVDLVQQIARATATEVAATGIHWVFSPVLCITRDLRWGRVGETFGEDPYLISELGAAMVRGYQGGGLADPEAVLACAKHFAGYSDTQGGRDASEADISPRKLRSWFLPPFQRAVQEGCRTVMLGYQAMDGVPITANRWLLDDVLRGEWNFTGTLVTDWDNVGRMVWEQQVCADLAEAAAVAVLAGNDLTMTTPGFFDGALEAIDRDLISDKHIDDAVRNLLRIKFELGLFEDPRRPDIDRQQAVIGRPEHTALNLEVARRSLVLLQNDGVLPLEPTAPLRIAVVGPNADDPQGQLGDWAGSSGQVDWMPDGHPRELIETVLDGFRLLAPDGWAVDYSRGADIVILQPDPAGELLPDGQPRPPLVTAAPADSDLIAAATRIAAAADHVIAVVGDTMALVGEGRSTATLELIGGQLALLDALAAIDTPMTVVVISSKPLVLPDSALHAAALIQAFNPGMCGGRAIAELVLGQIEPSGRLPVSFAVHAGQQPVYYNSIRGQHGDRYADLTQQPRFVFGDGLSYTTVSYAGLSLATRRVSADQLIRAQVTLTNSGDRPAVETVQLYIRDLLTSVTWADKELKGFQQVTIEPGASMVVDLELPAAACTLVTADSRRIVEPGAFELLVGPNSRNESLLAAEFRID